jgi:hypothetical protein
MGSQLQWYVLVTNYIPVMNLHGVIGVPIGAIAQPPVQAGTTFFPIQPCTCFPTDCSNPAVGSQCPITCSSGGCTGSPTFVCSAIYGYNSPTCVNGKFTCPTGSAQCAVPPPTEECGAGNVLTCGTEGWFCNCYPGNCSTCPIIIDTANQGFHLTGWKDGVLFNFFPDVDMPFKVSWTDPNYENGWLVLDRNGNGLIDNGTELFGNLTQQPPSQTPNGFAALAVFDLPENGGNDNGLIDSGDAVYSKLRVWIDANHDGISQPNELKTLAELGIDHINLSYRAFPFVDRFGNQYRYQGMLWDGADKDAAYDVFLLNSPPQQ